MKRLAPFLCRWVAISSTFVAVTGGAALDKIPDPQIANKVHITVQQLHSLRDRFHLDNRAVLALTPIQLQIMLFEITHPGIDRRAEEQNFRALHLKDENGNISPHGLTDALRQHRRHQNPHGDGGGEDLFPGLPDPSTQEPGFGSVGAAFAGIGTNLWTWLGPGNIGGRVRSILIHPTQTNIMWCGGVDGGVWKTTNSGAAWFPLNDFVANLAISCMVMSPTNPNVIYAGTGESTYNIDAIRGAGIFRTTDGGASWTQLSATVNSSFQYVGKLAMDPSGQIVLAATRSGVFRSTDAGASWSQRLAVEVRTVAFSPSDSTNCIASGYNGKAFYSIDGGVSWAAASGLPAPTGFVVGRVEVAYAPSAPSTVYASMDTSSGQIYASADAGHTYALRNTGNNYLGGQGWYDNALWVDPTTTNVVIVGGTDLWLSTDGGATLTRISQWQSAPGSAHADQHVIVSSPAYDGSTVRTVFFGDDGGVYRANDVYTVSQTSGWQSLNNNLGITQFYGGAGNASSGAIVGGTQDNGSLRYTTAGGTGGWTAMFGGDGGFSAADSSDPNYFYGEYVDLQIHRSANGGASSSYIYSGITDAGSGSTANFIAPFILDPNNANTMLAGGSSLWRSVNVKAGTPSWASIKASVGSLISAIAVAPGNSSVIWVGHNSGAVYSTANGTATTPTWVLRNSGLPGRYCERIAISPTNVNKVYATFGGYNSGNLWRTLNGGVSWVNISAGLPSAPINCVTIAPADPNTLYVGTEVGIYGSSNDGSSWSTGNNGPANVSVNELFWLGNKLVAVTHGRGMFVTVPALGPANFLEAGNSVGGGNGNSLVDPNECNIVNLAVQNTGAVSATNVNAVLSSSTPGVSIVQAYSAYPNVASTAFATNATPFQISTLPSYVCGTPVVLTLTLTFNNSTNTLSYTLPAGNGGGYALTQTNGASIVPGVTDVGNNGDDVTTDISLPFSYTFYGQSFNTATVDSNGKLSFVSGTSAYQNVCLPSSTDPNTIFALWDDLRTDGGGQGIFTSTSGAAPNRIFNIEWRAAFFGSGLPANFEVRLYEGQQRVDLIYGTMGDNGSSATVGIEKDAISAFVPFECNSGGLSAGLQLTFQPSCGDGGGVCAPYLNFTGTPLSGAAPLKVNFSNFSGGATNFNWNFGDGQVSSLTVPTNTYAAAGTYSVMLAGMGPGGSNALTRTNYILVTNAPPSITAQPQDKSVIQGNPATFTVTALGTPPLSYQWRFTGVPVAQGTNSSFAVPNPHCIDSGAYDVVISNIGGVLTSSVATLTVVTPAGISIQPVDQTVIAGQAATFSVTATNECGGGPTYQWRHGVTNLPGATAASLNLASAQVADAGNYSVVVSNLAGAITSSVAVLTVLVPPSFTLSPASQAIVKGTNATFTASASGNPVPTYQWRFAGAPVAGATQSAYSRTNVQCAGSGAYDVVAVNSAASATSSVAILTVIAPPEIVAPPTNQTVNSGQPSLFSVSASNECGMVFSYQWRFQGTNLANATNTTFARANTQVADAGNYSVVVSNLAGSITSSIAVLSVTPDRRLVVSPASVDFGSVYPGYAAQASFVISNGGWATLNATASVTAGPFALLDSSSNTVWSLGFTVSPAGSTNMGISFIPSGSGNFSNAVLFASDGGNSTNAMIGQGLVSPLLLSPSLGPDGFIFSFNTISGKTYVIQYKDLLADPVWQTLQTVPGDGTLKIVTNAIAPPVQRFYRLNVQ